MKKKQALLPKLEDVKNNKLVELDKACNQRYLQAFILMLMVLKNYMILK